MGNTCSDGEEHRIVFHVGNNKAQGVDCLNCFNLTEQERANLIEGYTKNLQNMKAGIDRMLFNPNTTTTASPPQGNASSITLDDMMKVRAKMDALPPFITAIWFINESSACTQFTLEYKQRYPVNNPASMLRIYEWALEDMNAHIEMQKADERDGELFSAMLERGELYPFRKPGVWVEMNKGNHYWMVAGQLIELTPKRNINLFIERVVV